MDPKKVAAEKAVEYIESGMTVGLGTGSTAYWAIQKIGEKVREGLHIKAMPTSLATEKLARELNIPLLEYAEKGYLDIAIDGADEVDAQGNMIKGGGGALMREKIVAYNSRLFIVVAGESKLVEHLGKFPLPVEILSFGCELTLNRILRLCTDAKIRQANGQNYITDNGHFIVDCHFHFIENAASAHNHLKNIPGVLETGIFLKAEVNSLVVVGYETGDVKVIK